MKDNTELVQSKTNFGVHLEGESFIDAELLSKMIHDMVKLTNLAAKEEDPEAYLKMNVTAFENGSFQIDFSAICEFAKTFFTNVKNVSEFAAAVVTVVEGFFAVKKHLNGQLPKSKSKPDSKGNIIVENNKGQKIKVKKSSGAIIENVQIDSLTVNISEYVSENNPNGGFSFNSENGTTKYNAEDIKTIAKHLPIKNDKICNVSTVNTYLLIKKADFLGKSSWDFKYNKHNITAKVMDDDLIDLAHSGAPIRAGDYIFAELEIRVDLDEMGLPVDGTEQYTVIKVIGGIHHKEEGKQLGLF